MSAGQDLIRFDESDDWRLIVTEQRNATIINDFIVEPIGSFDLGVSLEAEYIAVVAITGSGKPTWIFAGDITQTYDFARGAGNSTTDKVRPQPFKLFLDRMQVIPVGRLSTEPFRLQYTPPSWFRDVAIRVYEYIGTPVNFLEDKIYDIGQVLGLEPDTPDNYLQIQFQSIRLLVDERITNLENQLEDCCNQLRSQLAGSQFGSTGGGDFTINEPTDSLGFNYNQDFL